MNVKLLRKVAKHILEEPKRLDMNTLGERKEGPGAPPCGTATCISGWSCVLGQPKAKVGFNSSGDLTINGLDNLWGMGRRLLRLTDTEAVTLFREPCLAITQYDGTRTGWPEKFSKGYTSARSAKQRARITVARIEHFIKTKGRE
jgi:hypothetical protein